MTGIKLEAGKPAPEAGSAEYSYLAMRERVSALREVHRRKMNDASARAEMAASVGDMKEVSINSTESERHREAFVALNVAIEIIDQTEYSGHVELAPEAGAVAAATPDWYRYKLSPSDDWWASGAHRPNPKEFPRAIVEPLYASPPPPPVSAEVIGKLVDALRMARLYIVDDVKRKPSEYDPSVDLKRIDAVLALVGEVR